MSGPGLAYADRVQETSTTTGTGTLTLGGASAGFQSFSSAFVTGQTVYYMVTDGTNWEVGRGTFTTSGTTLSRDQVFSSSNAGALVNLPAGTKTATCVQPAVALADRGMTVGLSVGMTAQ